MYVETCVKISDKSDKKGKSYSLYNLTTYTRSPAVIRHWRGKGWGIGGGCNGPMYCLFFYLSAV